MAAMVARARAPGLPARLVVADVSGAHWRDLDADLERVRLWTDTLVLLVEDHELEAAGVAAIRSAAGRHGLTLIHFPIPDPHVPTDLDAYRALVADLAQRVREASPWPSRAVAASTDPG